MTGYLKVTILAANSNVQPLVASNAPLADRLLPADQVVFIQLDAQANDAAYLTYVERGSNAPSAVDATNATHELMPGVEYRLAPSEWAEGGLPLDLSRLYFESVSAEASGVSLRVRRRASDTNAIS